ncbi:hypothetical protein HUN92_21990 [Bacillus firmus]|uniref:hypothetical protein n=1 Tax=Cytobacillus firmus TaxID=1399 RepID=UPI00157FCAE1|nr:hypothetical protein [Cytobacillus firmus]NUH86315.1 hypothetical protein [Cytobacillus firmus]
MTSKSTGSMIKVWETQKGECFKVHIEELGITLTVGKKDKPKTYSKIKQWIESDPDFNPILFEKE